MPQHFTRSTVSAEAYCKKCQNRTQHRVDDRRIGPCLECIAKLDKLYQEHEKFERELQQSGFEWT